MLTEIALKNGSGVSSMTAQLGASVTAASQTLITIGSANIGASVNLTLNGWVDKDDNTTAPSWFDITTATDPKITVSGLYLFQADVTVTGALSSSVHSLDVTLEAAATLPSGGTFKTSHPGPSATSPHATAVCAFLVDAGSLPGHVAVSIGTNGGNLGTLVYDLSFYITKLA